MVTIYKRARTYTGPSKYDRGYTRPQILDFGGSSSGGATQGHFAGGTPSITPTAPTLAVDLDTGNVWIFANSEWAYTGITLAL